MKSNPHHHWATTIKKNAEKRKIKNRVKIERLRRMGQDCLSMEEAAEQLGKSIDSFRHYLYYHIGSRKWPPE